MRFLGFNITRENRGVENPKYPLTYANVTQLLGESPTATGITVTPDKAATLTAVYACVSVIASTLATLPLSMYERTTQGKQRANEHPLQWLLHDEPNPLMSSVMFREFLQAQLLFWGDALCEIQRNRIGEVVGLWPLLTRHVTPEIVVYNGRRLRVYHAQTAGGRITLPDEAVLHVPGLSFDGVRGKSPIAHARQSLGLALAAEEFGAKLFGNGIRPSGVFESPNALSDQAYVRLKNSLESFRGLPGAHREMILEENLKWHQTAVNPEDAQFLETRKFQRSEIASMFRVPPHMIGDLEKATFSNIEQQSLDFEKHTMRTWIVRWEQEINRKLLAPDERGRYFARFSVDGLLRGDIKTRYDAYAVARTNGWLSANEIRELEDMNRIDGGDKYLTPLNMTGASAPDSGAGNKKTPVNKREVYDLLANLLQRTENDNERP